MFDATIAAIREYRIQVFMEARPEVTRETAVAYLEAEEWDATDAVQSYDGDTAFNQKN
jgi:hypothetical protein